MRFRVRSTRNAADFPPDGEAALRLVPGLGGLNLDMPSSALAGAGLDGLGLSGTGLPRILAQFSARPDGSRPGQQLNRATGGNSGSETAPEAQPSATVGVPEDMASLVLDNSALGESPRKSAK